MTEPIIELPPLASVRDLEARMQRTFTAGPELDGVESLIDEASEIVRVEAKKTFVSPDDPSVSTAPRIVSVIVVRMVDRALRNPDGLSSESAADYSYQRNGVPPDGGLFLTDQELKWLRGGNGNSGVWALGYTRGDLHPLRAEGVWLEDSFGCELFPVGPRG